MKVLVANRGEIAVRILRACRELGLRTVAVYSEADEMAMHTRYADEAICIGPAPAAESYLNIEAVLDAARKSGATAIHPGYGFLSENVAFTRAVEQAGLRFIGPRSETIALTGDKLAALQAAREAGLPVLSGLDVPLSENSTTTVLPKRLHFPLLVKAVSGGGGRGIRLANNEKELHEMIAAAAKEAQAAFGDGKVYLEPLVRKARHIEVQIFGDGEGNILIFGDRECSIQRRRQKLIEEAPAPGLSDDLRQRIHQAAYDLGTHLNYRSLGTVEFLLDEAGSFYFIEINPRIQVEHPVTEMVTGIDLVSAQLRQAAGKKWEYCQEDIQINGSAIEARILAEDPENNFMPTTGVIRHIEIPAGPGIRVDSALYPGMEVTPEYDSLLAKAVVWGENRNFAIRRLRRALREFRISGIQTDLGFLQQIVDSIGFIIAKADTTYLDTFKPPQREIPEEFYRGIALATALHAHRQTRAGTADRNKHDNRWRLIAWREQMRGTV